MGQAEIAGSVRRKLETVGDLDCVVAATDEESVTVWFCKQPFVKKILSQGKTKASILLKEGLSLNEYEMKSVRKGWLEKDRVLNTFSLKDVRLFLEKPHP